MINHNDLLWPLQFFYKLGTSVKEYAEIETIVLNKSHGMRLPKWRCAKWTESLADIMHMWKHIHFILKIHSLIWHSTVLSISTSSLVDVPTSGESSSVHVWDFASLRIETIRHILLIKCIPYRVAVKKKTAARCCVLTKYIAFGNSMWSLKIKLHTQLLWGQFVNVWRFGEKLKNCRKPMFTTSQDVITSMLSGGKEAHIMRGSYQRTFFPYKMDSQFQSFLVTNLFRSDRTEEILASWQHHVKECKKLVRATYMVVRASCFTLWCITSSQMLGASESFDNICDIWPEINIQ